MQAALGIELLQKLVPISGEQLPVDFQNHVSRRQIETRSCRVLIDTVNGQRLSRRAGNNQARVHLRYLPVTQGQSNVVEKPVVRYLLHPRNIAREEVVK